MRFVKLQWPSAACKIFNSSRNSRNGGIKRANVSWNLQRLKLRLSHHRIGAGEEVVAAKAQLSANAVDWLPPVLSWTHLLSRVRHSLLPCVTPTSLIRVQLLVVAIGTILALVSSRVLAVTIGEAREVARAQVEEVAMLHEWPTCPLFRCLMKYCTWTAGTLVSTGNLSPRSMSSLYI